MTTPPEAAEPSAAPLYRATAKWDRGNWTVRIEGPGGSVAGGTVATGLDLVEAKTREILAADGGLTRIDVVVDLMMPVDIAQRFQLAEDLVRDVEAEIEDAQRELLALDWPAADVEWASRQHRLTPGPRLITITNQALATVGLDEHPEVLGVRWQDHGRFQTITCRSCVEQSRAVYRDAPPEELNELIRVAWPDLYCDHCNCDLATKADTESDDANPMSKGEETVDHSQEPQWRTSRFSDGMQCVQIADLGDGTIGVRDSKDPDGPTLHFTRGEMNAFATGVKSHEFDDLLL